MKRRSTTAARPILAGTWTVDPARSTVCFSVRHLLVATVRGRFTDFDGGLHADASGALRAAGAVRVASIDTGHAVRDEHLRGPRYFDADRHPEIRFASTAIEPLDGTTLRIVGDLTIKHATRAIELRARRSAAPDGRLELDVYGALCRREFGIDSAELLDAGISDRVTLTLQLSLGKRAPDGSTDGHADRARRRRQTRAPSPERGASHHAVPGSGGCR